MREHPFDRYSAFTDIAALKAASVTMLRKSIRVNTLKCAIEEVHTQGRSRGWTMTPVPWCAEGFFVDRVDRRAPLGKDLLHLIGAIYMQEAASMLPVELLDPRPGETVLDLCAAPGSKTTQIAARMHMPLIQLSSSERWGNNGNAVQGVIVCNEVQEKRLWTLLSALHRCGVTNAIATKKVGQWFGKHMTERFDRVLVDAPCTAQGTVRKDSDALLYASDENTAVMARLQAQLLEAGVHAAKVGARIVYSTCTLTPEENEGVLLHILNKFCDQLEIVDPRGLWAMDDALRAMFTVAMNDAERVFHWLKTQDSHLNARNTYALRMWPQTFDTEGFFCAVLRKTAPTKAVTPVDRVLFADEELPRARSSQIANTLSLQFGCPFLRAGERLFLRSGAHAEKKGEGQILLAPSSVAAFMLPTRAVSIGLPFCKVLMDRRVRISHELTTLRGREARAQIVDVSENDVQALLSGRDAPCDSMIRGDHLLRYHTFCIGRGLAKNGVLKNNLPRWMIR